MNKLYSKKKMSFLSHFEELRNHILRSFIGIIIGTGIIMMNQNLVFDYILFAPAKSNFITYRILNFLGYYFNKRKIIILPNNLHIQNRYLLGQFNSYIWISFLGGIILSFPYTFYEIWSFIRPGLSKKENNYLQGIVLSATILFSLGIFFGYFILFPMIIQFSYNFHISSFLENIFDLNDYIFIITHSTLSMGLIFLFPIIIFFLTKIGLISPKFLKTYRKHALLIILVISAAITPSDLLSMIIVTIPLIILYEISIFSCIFFLKKN